MSIDKLIAETATREVDQHVSSLRFENQALTARVYQLETLLGEAGVHDFVQEKDVYDVHDLARLTGKKADTIRTNYLSPGKIHGTKRDGMWEIPSAEFNRIKDLVERGVRPNFWENN